MTDSVLMYETKTPEATEDEFKKVLVIRTKKQKLFDLKASVRSQMNQFKVKLGRWVGTYARIKKGNKNFPEGQFMHIVEGLSATRPGPTPDRQ